MQCLVQCHHFAMLADLYSGRAASYYTAFFSVAFVVYFLRKKGESSLQAETPAMSCVQIWGMHCNAPADQQPYNHRQVISHYRRPSMPATAAWPRCVCALHSQPGSQGLLPTAYHRGRSGSGDATRMTSAAASACQCTIQ